MTSFKTLDPSPISPESKPPSNRRTLEHGTPQATPLSKNNTAYNQQAYAHHNGLSQPNRTPSLEGARLSQPSVALPTPRPVVIVPALPPSSQHDEYKDLPDSITTALPKKRKRTEFKDDGRAVRLQDQREKANVASQALQELLREIFEAQDQVQPDASNGDNSISPVYFDVSDDSEGSGLVLTRAISLKLDSALSKSIGANRLQDIPVDDLVRAQKLLDGRLREAQVVNLKVQEAWNDDDIQDWLRKVDNVEAAMSSTRTLLRTMTGGRQEKQLYTEDLIQGALNLLNNVLEDGIVPIVEARSTGQGHEVFRIAVANKKVVGQLMNLSRKLLVLFGEVFSNIEVADGMITTIEYLATKLIFAENAQNEKDSALGIQKYEVLRRSAMDVLSKIFARYTEQRSSILDHILTSLEKLPSTRQSARQYKLAEGKPIQLVSALVMQLVQTTAIRTKPLPSEKRKRRIPRANGKDLTPEVDEREDENPADHQDDESHDESDAVDDEHDAVQTLRDTASPLYDATKRSAHYIIVYFVQRAAASTKSGDEPYRNLLDIFIEDLINVLGSVEWPAAEVLLRMVTYQMTSIVRDEKSSASAKNMAIELLGWVASAISDLSSTTQQLAKNPEIASSELGSDMRRAVEDHFEGRLDEEILLDWDGPYRVVFECIRQHESSDSQMQTARGYILTQWARGVTESESPEAAASAGRLRKTLLNPSWAATHDNFEDVTPIQGRLAYMLVLLNTELCKAFVHVLRVLLDSFSSDQATLRSRGLKSVAQLLEKHPNLLDRDSSVIRRILRCVTDSSPMVRDSSLTLIGKCVVMRPALEEEAYKMILCCLTDGAIGVRKRAMSLLKEMYLRNDRDEMRATIAESLLHQVKDDDDGVRLLAWQMFEEIWFTPFYKLVESSSEKPKTKIALNKQIVLMVRTVQRGESVIPALEFLLRTILSKKSKVAGHNFEVCKAIVAAMFEGMLDNTDASAVVGQQTVLRILTTFAKTQPKLFTPDQLQLLQPYIKNLSTGDDLVLFRSVVVILRCTLPRLSSTHASLLKVVSESLLQSVSKLARPELNEVMACLSTVQRVLQNDRLLRLAKSVLKPLDTRKDVNYSSPESQTDFSRAMGYVRITGSIGKFCDLEQHLRDFQESFSTRKVLSVAGLMTELIAPFAHPKQPLKLRTLALESLGLICQSWPDQFGKDHVYRAFDAVFKEDDPVMKDNVLGAFGGFFAAHEGLSDAADAELHDEDSQAHTSRLGGSLTASDNDGAAALIAQHFLKDILKVAAASQDGYALTATQVIASINRQGLVHPKECGATLIALETSTNLKIAQTALEIHRMLHQQHETMFEREYMRAVYEAFIYQRDIAHDPAGFTSRPITSKLHPLFDVIKTSNGKYQKKFLSTLCSKIQFDPNSLDTSQGIPDHLQFATFVIENLAFFDFGRVEELLHALSCMEKVVAEVGAGASLAIDAELFGTQINGTDNAINVNNGQTIQAEQQAIPSEREPRAINPMRLRELAVSSMILCLLWEARSHLRRLYGLTSSSRTHGKGKAVPKELTKAPSKAAGITPDRFLEADRRILAALESTESMVAQCKDLVTLMSVDDEVKISNNELDMDEEGLETPSIDGEDRGSAQLGRKKRKGSVALSNASETPKKKRRGRPSLGGRKKSAGAGAGAGENADGDWD